MPDQSQLASQTEQISITLLNEFFIRATSDSGMTDNQTEILKALQKQEIALFGLLQSVRQTIQMVQSNLPVSPQSLRPRDDIDLLLDLVLAGLGEQFTSVDIFETAKKLKPGLRRSILREVVERLQNYRLILKVEDGRGRRPARFRKQVFN